MLNNRKLLGIKMYLEKLYTCGLGISLLGIIMHHYYTNLMHTAHASIILAQTSMTVKWGDK